MRLLLPLLLLAGCAGPPDAPPRDTGLTAADAGSPEGDDAGLALDAGPPDADAAIPGAEAFTVASWNIEQFPRDTRTVDEVARLVIAHELDLVGIQEITDRDAFEALADALPEHERVIAYAGWQRVGFLYRPDRLEVSEIDLLWNDDRWAFPRPGLTARIGVRADDGSIAFDFDFVVVHLKAQVDDESRMRREAAIARMEAWMRARSEVEPEILIVGDFNDELLDPPEWNVYRPLLEAPDRYSFLTLPNERAGEYSYLSFQKMIDHVLVTTALERIHAGPAQVLRLDESMADYRDVVSDHLPVVSRFRLTP